MFEEESGVVGIIFTETKIWSIPNFLKFKPHLIVFNNKWDCQVQPCTMYRTGNESYNLVCQNCYLIQRAATSLPVYPAGSPTPSHSSV